MSIVCFIIEQVSSPPRPSEVNERDLNKLMNADSPEEEEDEEKGLEGNWESLGSPSRHALYTRYRRSPYST
jgi:hypothetical protein